MARKVRHSQWLFPYNNTVKFFICLGLLLFAAMAWIAFKTPNRFDEKVFHSINHEHKWITDIMHYVTILGNTETLVVANCLLVLFLMINKERWVALEVVIVALTCLGLMSVLKRSFHRIRPPHPLIEGITNYSFPSGHAFMSLAFYGLMMWWATIHLKIKWQQQLAISFFAFLILLIGFSRIYLRVHYTTDVLAGFGMSTAWLLISLAITDRLIKKTPIVK